MQVIAQVANALHVLHSMSIVHRDLKPDNILIMLANQDKPIVKLADFGISIILDDPRRGDAPPGSLAAAATVNEATPRQSNLTQTGVLVGTPLYMAPELGDGSRNAQPPADIFALGIIAFELLTGKKPYSFPPVLGGSIDADVAEKLQACPGLRADVAKHLASCLDMNPAHRPKADDLAAACKFAANDGVTRIRSHCRKSTLDAIDLCAFSSMGRLSE